MNLNAHGRRSHREDERILYDEKKARPFFTKVCADKKWNIIKDFEDYKEDFILQISELYYFVEIQVAGHWHNFDLDKISNFYISAYKIDTAREINKKHRGTIIFTNCVPNRWVGFNVDQVKDDWKYQDQQTGEFSYKIPIKELDIEQNTVMSEHMCDCLENHYKIMQRHIGRMSMAEREFNIRGKNGICC